MTIPDSISALVYGMKHDIWWILGVWAVAGCGLATMIPHSSTYAGIAFASCFCLALVGAMPLVKGEHNTLHNIFGIAACLLSQLWVFLVGNRIHLFFLWTLYLIVLLLLLINNKETKWCFFAEIWCFISIAKEIIS